MTSQAVHWHEGMFLRPQHFQAADRHLHDLVNVGSRWNLHYCWGLRSLSLDTDALANYRLSIRSLEARLPEGTLLRIPTDSMPPHLDLRNAFGTDNSLTLYLATPILQLTRSNVAVRRTQETNGHRFSIDTKELEDENTGVNPLPVQFRVPNVKVLTSRDDHAGYEVLPIARLRRGDMAEAIPQLDETYIPPLLACDAWKPLEVNILQPIYDRIGKKIELLSAQVVSRNITFDSQGQGDRLLFEQLRTMNRAFAPLKALLYAQGVHPFTVYQELCRAVGDLAIFGAARRPPELPNYDHDDLATCFYGLKQQLDGLLDGVVEPEYQERPFIGAGLRMQVALEPAWLESGRELFVGVQANLAAAELQRLLSSGLDMKIGSSERVDETFRLGHAGLRFSYASHPPRSLPARSGLAYFRIDRQTQADDWKNVERSLSLAIRLNENLITSNIQGQRELTIRLGGQSTNLQFTLYVVPQTRATSECAPE